MALSKSNNRWQQPTVKYSPATDRSAVREMASRRNLKALTLSEKKALIDELSNGAKNSDVAVKYGVARSTVSTIWKNKDKVCQNFENSDCGGRVKRVRQCKYDDVDKAVSAWFRNKQNLPFNGPIIKETALFYAEVLGHKEFCASDGWLEKFKGRHDFVAKAFSGEKSTLVSASDAAGGDWITGTLPKSVEEYSSRNIFGVYQTGLLFKCQPSGLKSKEQITLLLGTNIEGAEKLETVVIGKSKNPRCIRDIRSLNAQYFSDKRSLLNNDIFFTWLLKLDQRFANENRKILLFVDNRSTHFTSEIQAKLNFIKLEHFPHNPTVDLQPMDLGIIQNFKAHYRKYVLLKTINSFEERKELPKLSLLECIRYASKAWLNVKEETIQSNFQKAGFGRLFERSDKIQRNIAVKIATDAVREVELLWNKMLEVGIDVGEATCEDYLQVDSDIIADDQDIPETSESSDESDVEEEVDFADVNKALSVLRRALETSENVPESIFRNFHNLEEYLQKKSTEQSV